jgi:exodeoxyribonuclease V gamma subunit
MPAPARRPRAAAAAEVPQRGLLVFRASRLEALLAPLEALLAALPPDALLAPHRLIAAHPGMRRWLLNALARRAGARGIAANLDIALPGQWLDREAATHLPDLDPQAAYAGDALRWRLLDLLGQPALRVTVPELAAYLEDAHGGGRRWQLAGQLADLFGRLLVYRGDWLAAWQAGRDGLPEPTLLAALWRALRAAIGLRHRGERHAELLQALRVAPAESTPLHVFGLAHLPPRHLDALRAAAAQRLVVLYLPDPCVEHWAGLRNDAGRLRQLLAAPPGQDAESLYLAVEHPLLASLGRLGQQFGVLLAAGDEATALEIRAGEDATPTPAARAALLGRLQDSIRRLRPALLRRDDGGAADAHDASLRVHRCHSPLRELEVLRDALLQAFVELDDLRPAEIAVLAPDMAAYAPLLAAVFGPPARHDAVLPYHTADLPLAAAHPLLAGFQRLLALPRGRLGAGELLDLLGLPALQRALGLAAEDVERIADALRDAAAAWGLDGAHRAEQGVPALAERTLAWSLDRLCTGYVFGDDDEDAPPLQDGILPAGRLGDADADVLGALQRLFDELAALQAALREPAPASRWIARFRGLRERLFVADPQDAGETAAVDALDTLFGRLERARHDAGIDPRLDGDEALALLQDGLAEVPQAAAFLHGGITFCGMVPQRALPYRMIAVLGLDDASFPRAPRAPQFDPLPRHPRLGDRDVQRDDRYLFLETLMAARERLHLSWVGEGARDGRPRNPSPVLAELLDLLDGELADAARPWLVSHPLQPFDARYLPAPPRATACHAPALAAYARAQVALPPMPPPAAAAPAAVAPLVGLGQLERWLRDPARELLAERRQVRLDGLEDDSLPDSEPLDAAVDPRATLWRQLLEAALAGGGEVPPAPTPWLRASGLLPPGLPGEQAYAVERATATALLAATRAHLPWLGAEVPREALELDVVLGAGRLQGTLAALPRHAGALWLLDWSPREAGSRELARQLRLLLRWCLLQLATPADAPPARLLLLNRDGADDWATRLDQLAQTAPRGALAAAARARLEGLLALYLDAARRPLAYFPKASAALLDGKEAASVWLGGPRQRGERDYAPGYARLLAGDAAFWRDPDSGFGATIERLQALLDPGRLAAEVAGA